MVLRQFDTMLFRTEIVHWHHYPNQEDNTLRGVGIIIQTKRTFHQRARDECPSRNWCTRKCSRSSSYFSGERRKHIIRPTPNYLPIAQKDAHNRVLLMVILKKYLVNQD